MLTAHLRSYPASSVFVFVLALLATSAATPGMAQAGTETENMPSLIVTNDPPPEVIYRPGSRDALFGNMHRSPGADSLALGERQNIQTLVTRKVDELNKDLSALQGTIASYQDRLSALRLKSDNEAAEYYNLVAAINTELQAGTTPGNPILVERWNAAQDSLNRLSESAGFLSELLTDVSAGAARAAYLQESVRATYSLSGAVREDHRRLRETEDQVNQSIVAISRLMTSVSDEIKRRDSYLRAERLNMQTMTLAIANGELYGQSLANRLFTRAAEDGRAVFGDAAVPPAAAAPVAAAPIGPVAMTSQNEYPAPVTSIPRTASAAYKGAAPSYAAPSYAAPQHPVAATAARTTGRRPLVIIRFDRPNVSYEQAVYTAVGQALDRYPAARFDLVAVNPTEGNPAELALASSEARKNGEDVLRSLMQMGLPVERVRLNTASSQSVRNSEVHIYLR